MADKPFSNPSSMTEQLQNLCWRLAVEMRALYNTVADKLSTTDADTRYLGITAKAASAATADTATRATSATTADSATKATQDGNGNVISSTYAKNTSIPTVMTGATASSEGKAGTVPAPAAGAQGKFLRGDGTWQTALTSHQSLGGYAKTSAIPTKTSQLTNDSGFLTSHQSLDGCLKTSGGTLSGSLTFANSKGNLVGDDCYFGDSDIAGAVCIQGNNGNTKLVFRKYGGATWGTNTASEQAYLEWDGSTLNSTKTFTIGGAAVALASDIPTKTSQLTNNSGFLTSHQSLAGYAKVTSSTADLTAGSSALATGQIYLVYE